jgi:hypothetical protein
VGTPISNRRGKDPLGILTKGTKEHSDAMNSPSVKTRFKGLAKSINVFSKKEDTGSQTSLHKLDSPSVDKKTSPLGGSMMGTAQKAMMLQSRRPRSASTNLLLSTQSDSSLSLHGTGSSIGSGTESPTSPGHAAHSAQSRHFPSSYRMSTLSKTASIHIDDETADSKSFIERELENVMSQELLVMEDRDTPTDNEQKDLSGDPERIAAFEEKFLKKSDWRSPVKYPPETAQAQTQKVHSFVLLKLHQPEEQPVIVKVQGDMIMEAYCQKLCVRKGLDYETHSFEYGPELKPVEMDVKAGILFTPVTATDVHLVKKAKVYSSISTVEETEETIISNVVDGKYVIMASKKERIFDLLTSTDFEDEKFTNVIFLTYRSFSTPTEFLEYLIVSFYSTLPENASEGDTELYQRTKIPTQLKILKVLHKWIEHHWHDFGLDSQLRTTLQIFLNKTTSQEGEFTEVCRGLLFVADIQVC